MSLFHRITGNIHLNFNGTSERRSEELWDVCCKSLPGRVGCYLDIGTYSGNNAVTFGDRGNAEQIVGIDLAIPSSNVLRRRKGADLLVGDGLHLPLGDSRFDIVSLISVLEHVPDPVLLCHEVFRTLKKGGVAIIQIPNRFFPIELHCGIPFLFYLPKKIRDKILEYIGYGYMLNTQVPSLKEFLAILKEAHPYTEYIVKKLNYSQSIVPANIRLPYKLIKITGILQMLPMGYIIIVKKL